MQGVSVRGPGPDLRYSETQRGEKGRMGLGERKAEDKTNLELGVKA